MRYPVGRVMGLSGVKTTDQRVIYALKEHTPNNNKY